LGSKSDKTQAKALILISCQITRPHSQWKNGLVLWLIFGETPYTASDAYCNTTSRSDIILRMLIRAYRIRPNAVLILTRVRPAISLKLMSA